MNSMRAFVIEAAGGPEKLPQAHQLMDQNRANGKIVITVEPSE